MTHQTIHLADSVDVHDEYGCLRYSGIVVDIPDSRMAIVDTPDGRKCGLPLDSSEHQITVKSTATRNVLHTHPRPFHLQRSEDATGVSGVGKVAEGVVFSNGWCALTWLTENTSVAFYPSIETLEAIHGHHGNTAVVYD